MGGFHRAHQAWALQTLKNRQKGAFDDWAICGVCIMDSDLPFVDAFRKQDCLYYVQSFAADGTRENLLVDVIQEILHSNADYTTILARVAAEKTQVISLRLPKVGIILIIISMHLFGIRRLCKMI